MRKLIPFRTPGQILIGFFALVLVVQMAVLAGVVPAEIVWGGRLENDTQRTVRAMVAIVVLLLAMSVVLIRLSRIGRSIPAVGRSGMWIIVCFSR